MVKKCPKGGLSGQSDLYSKKEEAYENVYENKRVLANVILDDGYTLNAPFLRLETRNMESSHHDYFIDRASH